MQAGEGEGKAKQGMHDSALSRELGALQAGFWKVLLLFCSWRSDARASPSSDCPLPPGRSAGSPVFPGCHEAVEMPTTTRVPEALRGPPPGCLRALALLLEAQGARMRLCP